MNRRSLSRRAAAGLAVAAVAAMLAPAAALAHPLGNFTINHSSGVRVSPDQVVVDHVLDLAEIPTFAAFRAVDADADGIASPAERSVAAATRCAEQSAGLVLTVGGARVPLTVAASTVAFLAGQGAPTMRLVCRLEVNPPAGVAGALTFADATFPERAGWREIRVEGDGLTVTGAVEATSPSARLTAYPSGMLAEVPSVSSVAFSVAPGGPSLAPMIQPELASEPGATGDPVAARSAAVPGGITELGEELAGLFGAEELTLPVVVLSMLAAVALGALHALSPGHGKTVMAAYLVGSRGSARQALGLGTTVTVSHTLGVLALAVLSLSASAVIPPERLYPILGVVSGTIVVVIAGWLLLGIARGWRTRRSAEAAHARVHAAVDAHEHVGTAGHGHAHGAHAHHHGGATGDVHLHGAHGHDHPQGAVAAAHAHDHDASVVAHAHDHGDGHAHDRDQTVGPDHGHTHAPDDDGYHSHGGLRHTHVLPTGQPLRWRALFALGLAGGMVPSVSAIILLLGSIAAGRPAYGIALTVAFGLGMAAVLVGIGLALVYARGLLDRLPARSPGRTLGRLIPAGSAAVMLGAGVLITTQAMLTLR